MIHAIHCHCPIRISPQDSRRAALEENPQNAQTDRSNRKKRSLGYTNKFWSPGRLLRISFINQASKPLKTAIVEAASKWLEFANLKFRLVGDRYSYAEIKIYVTDDAKTNYSMFGTDALRAADASMVLGVKPDMENFERVVIHEFGHALGMEHEHQHPDADIPWDIPKVYEHYAALGADKETVDESVLNKVSGSNITKLPYDRTSIMHYPVDQALTLGDWEVTTNSEISEKDKAFMRLAYPFPEQPTR
ncbi:M12 family metallopeptidase [Pseudomonas sp. PSKL.D1]|uniref:M12 family metallopeptidase n=1 Tax=Pseudomonas sp. PSKL.D1 TaxID=3029060 RepID=UPI002380F88B|nr:M12 family metallopeptidase [Pseudomonas sp. PSKL.D1]WDY56913.1 M12 family metallopeptidase [Pseudomonas sp. PSKL.D1]